jgi:hypothetical protein
MVVYLATHRIGLDDERLKNALRPGSGTGAQTRWRLDLMVSMASS